MESVVPSFLNEPVPSNLVRLECGTLIDLERPRWDGPLSQDEVVACRRASIPLAFDPVQIGWVMAHKQTREEFALEAARQRIVPAGSITEQQSMFKLRPWHADDLEVYLQLLNDPAVWAHLPEAYPDPLTRDQAAALIELSNTSNHHEVRAVIVDGQPVGQVRLLFEGEEALASAEISYWLGQTHWGRGIASAVVSDYTDISLYRHPQIRTLFARVHGENLASARVLEKAGYLPGGPDRSRAGWSIFHREQRPAR